MSPIRSFVSGIKGAFRLLLYAFLPVGSTTHSRNPAILHELFSDLRGSAVYQEDLLVETLQTLALLLPRSNTKCKRWFQRSLKKYPKLDHLAGDIELLPRSRTLEKYRYWNECLRIIIKAYESEPKTLPQWWHDRRNKVQWYTFWIAVLVLLLTIVFGLIQSITGAIQAYYASQAASQGSTG